jgi:DNA-binding beta-propeller fold protein YncE
MIRLHRFGLGGVLVLSSLAIAQKVPKYKVDPSWPKPLPNHWMLGHVETVVVDKDDHIWIAHYGGPLDRRNDHLDMGLAQNPPLSECCIPAPEVMEFDAQGNVLRAWGGPGYVKEWPEAIHAFWVDGKGNVWVGGNHAPDRNVLKFSRDGKLLLEIGRLDGPVGLYVANRPELGEPNNQATDLLGAPSGIAVDDQANEVYIADGYINKRVVVFDSNTGKFKRGWGAYGIPLSAIDNNKLPQNDSTVHNSSALSSYDPNASPDKQFRGPIESVRLSKDGLVYVADRNARRIQVFTKAGKFVREMFVAKDTLLQDGTTFGMSFSNDPQQKYLVDADAANNTVWFLNRSNGSVAGKFGHTGRNAGQFDVLNSVAIDSKGNLYTTEVKYNNRIQKFVPEK